jgi:hypothetical protein
MAGRARANGATGAKPGSYDQFKEYEGKRYTGMKVGRRHKWRYDPGEWTEKKVTPDKWEFEYAVKKHRHGHAPEGSGAPVGTAYRWYILAEQVVTKQDANSYTTQMAGLKYKLAHRRADKTSWSASERAQRKRLADILREMIADLEKAPEESPAIGPVASSTSPAAPAPPTASPAPAPARNGQRARTPRARAAKSGPTKNGRTKGSRTDKRAA